MGICLFWSIYTHTAPSFFSDFFSSVQLSLSLSLAFNVHVLRGFQRNQYTEFQCVTTKIQLLCTLFPIHIFYEISCYDKTPHALNIRFLSHNAPITHECISFKSKQFCLLYVLSNSTHLSHTKHFALFFFRLHYFCVHNTLIAR